MNLNELLRLILNLARKGTVLEVDHQAALCRVASGELETNWIPWLAIAAGTTRDWRPPTAGEQVLLICPGGDPADAVALSGIYSDKIPAPSEKPNAHTRIYPDGAVFEYDHENQVLQLTLPERAVLNLVASSAVNIKTGTVNVDGSLKTTGNVHAGTGASGTFTTPTGQIVTVKDGIVVNIT